MPTQKGGYFLADGTRVPSVTTVISRFKDAGGLIHWAWKLGQEGKDYRAERDAAADAGTLAHKMVEAWVKGESFVFPDTTPAEVYTNAHKAFDAFLEWTEQTQLRVTHTEMPLVSEQHRYGGTFDAILVGNRRAMGDWKSSNGVYPEYLIQLAAYGQLWEEHFPFEPLDGGYHLLRFDKTHGDFRHFWWADLGRAWEAFLHLRAMYDIDRELKQRVK